MPRYRIKSTLTATAMLMLAACSAQAPALAGDDGAVGEFRGLNGHTARGEVNVVERDGKKVVELGEGFFFDGAPDPKIGFGTNGKYVDGTLIGLIEDYSGAQSFPVPASLDISGYDEVYIWCEAYSVALGVARVD